MYSIDVNLLKNTFKDLVGMNKLGKHVYLFELERRVFMLYMSGKGENPEQVWAV